jgi:hypothetical protein
LRGGTSIGRSDPVSELGIQTWRRSLTGRLQLRHSTSK